MAQQEETAAERRQNNSCRNSLWGEVSTFLPKGTVAVSPEHELRCDPSWLFFQSSNGYTTPLYTEFTIQNRDNYAVCWCIKLKSNEKLFKASPAGGFLKAKEQRTVRLYLQPILEWQQDWQEYTTRRIRICVQNIRVLPELKYTTNDSEGITAREVYRVAERDFQFERMYTKLDVVIQRPEDLK
ncbi:hypothetical protein WR25_15242 [Diploscapter pachys]|uniref:MSP domain-containing protein n=1 Tax=Diploscapter pachys TaxID=2018661 RepID=A0A2A2LUU6_9BILA|nr:hypothetical protein WR25_15242 [Diploscapter pachys]